MKKYSLFVFIFLSLFTVNKANADVPPPSDTTAPVSTATAGGYVYGTPSSTDVTVTFECSDIGGLGCEITAPPGDTYPYHCIVEDDNPCTPDTATADLLIEQEGTWYVRYFSRDVAGNIEAIQSVIVRIDKTPPIVVSVKQTSSNIVEVLFDEDLQNNNPGHHPTPADFEAYNDLDGSENYNYGVDTNYVISGVSYDNKKVTITLTTPINISDKPRLRMWPGGQPNSLIDLAGNYLSGDPLEMPVEVFIPPQGSGGLLEYTPPAQTPPLPTGNNQTPPPGSGGQVLGAQTYQFTRTLRLGMKGDDVLELHKKLVELGFYKGPMDDNFGPLLLLSVKVFQMMNPPLKIDGIVGPLSRAVLNK